MQAYKVLHLDKAQGTIFSPEANVEKSGGKKDPDAMEIDSEKGREELAILPDMHWKRL